MPDTVTWSSKDHFQAKTARIITVLRSITLSGAFSGFKHRTGEMKINKAGLCLHERKTGKQIAYNTAASKPDMAAGAGRGK